MICEMETDMVKRGMMRYVTLVTAAGLGFAVTSSTALGAGPSEPGLPQLDISTWPSQIFWLIVIFGMGYVMMAKIVTPKIGSVLEDRRTRLDGDLDKAREASAEAVKIRTEYEAGLESARNDAAAFARNVAAEAAEKAALVEGKAANKLASKVAAAEKKLGAAKAGAIENLNTVAAEAALDAVRRLTSLKVTKPQADDIVKATAKSMAPRESN